MRDKKRSIQITSIVVVCCLAVVAIILRSIGLHNRNNVTAFDVGVFISSLIFFAAAILVSLAGKELVGLLIVLFTETIPAASGFVWDAAGGGKFGDVIKNNPYGFASFFILVILVILLALVLAYKPTQGEVVQRKWIFIPPAILFFYFLIFQAAGKGTIANVERFGLSLFFICIALTAAVAFNAALTGSIITFGALFFIPFHMGMVLDKQKDGHDGYIIAFWALGLILLILSIVWLGYEIYYAVKHKKKY